MRGSLCCWPLAFSWAHEVEAEQLHHSEASCNLIGFAALHSTCIQGVCLALACLESSLHTLWLQSGFAAAPLRFRP